MKSVTIEEAVSPVALAVLNIIRTQLSLNQAALKRAASCRKEQESV